jgi:periplasmic protein CpxP/Spy
MDMAMDNQNESGTPSRPRRRWGRRLLAAILLIGLGGVGGFAFGTHTAAAMFWHGMDRARLDPEATARRVEHRVNWVLSRAGADAEQKAKVSAIAKSAVMDISKLGLSPRETHEKFLALLRADTIDPQALEALRVEQAGKWDAVSKRIVQAVTEAAPILTAEQRRALTEPWLPRDLH